MLSIRLKRQALNNEDGVARLGGDEFVILLENIQSRDEVYRIAEAVLQSLQAPLHYNNSQFLLRGSIGIVIYPQDGDSAETLLRNADTSMYQAKAGGRGNIRFYSPEFSAKAQLMFALETDLHHALEHGEFELGGA